MPLKHSKSNQRRVMSLRFGVLLLTGILGLSSHSSLAIENPLDCDPLFLKRFVHADPLPESVRKWLDWEVTPSIREFAPENKTSPIQISPLNRSEVEVLKSARLPKEIESFFLHGEQVLWPKHPYNRLETTPFFSTPHLAEPLLGHHTASRSMAIEVQGKLYGLKMPTDHPFGPNRPRQIHKAFPKDSMRSSMRRTEIIEKIDQKLGADSELILLKDLLT